MTIGIDKMQEIFYNRIYAFIFFTLYNNVQFFFIMYAHKRPASINWNFPDVTKFYSSQIIGLIDSGTWKPQTLCVSHLTNLCSAVLNGNNNGKDLYTREPGRPLNNRPKSISLQEGLKKSDLSFISNIRQFNWVQCKSGFDGCVSAISVLQFFI